MSRHSLYYRVSKYKRRNMKVTIVLAALLAACTAQIQYAYPAYHGALAYGAHLPAVGHAVAAPAAPATHQFHSQSELGEYAFGHSGGPSTHTQTRAHNGIVNGAYSYVDSTGKVQTVKYVADALGFRAEGTNFPNAVVAQVAAPLVAPTFNPEPLAPIEDTPEVAAARAAHLAKHAEEAAREKRSLGYAAYPYAANYAFGAYPYAATYAHGAYPYAATYAHGAYPYAAATTYAAPAVPAAQAVLTKTILNPGHAVAYKVDSQ